MQALLLKLNYDLVSNICDLDVKVINCFQNVSLLVRNKYENNKNGI